MLLDDLEKTVGHFGIILGTIEQGFEVAFDHRKRGAQFVADIGHEFLARIFQLLDVR